MIIHKPDSPGKGYRFLVDGEVFVDGDDIWYKNKWDTEWKLTDEGKSFIGTVYCEMGHVPIRRKIDMITVDEGLFEL